MLKDDYVAHVSSLEVPAGDAHIEDVNAFLRVLAEARRFNNEIMVYPRQVCYRDRKARKELWKWISVPPSTFSVAAHKAKKTENLAYLAEHGLCTSAKKAYVQSKKCFYVIATPPNICHTKNHDFQAAAISDKPWSDEDIKKYYKEQEDWHCVCIVIHNKVMHIYDPSMDPGIVSLYGTFPPRLKDVPNLGRVQTFLEVLTGTTAGNPRRIDTIMWNGAGNMAGLCHKMSLDWLRGEVLELLGEGAKKSGAIALRYCLEGVTVWGPQICSTSYSK